MIVSRLLLSYTTLVLTPLRVFTVTALKAQSETDEAARKAGGKDQSRDVRGTRSVPDAASDKSEGNKHTHHHHHTHHTHRQTVPGTAVTRTAISGTDGKKPSAIIDVTCDYPDIADVSTSTTMCAKSPQPAMTASASATSTLYDAGSTLLGVLSFGYLGSYEYGYSTPATPTPTAASAGSETGGNSTPVAASATTADNTGASNTSTAVGDGTHMNKYIGDFCPPNVHAWNALASARAISIVMDLVCSQTISTAVTLLSRSGDVRSKVAPNGTVSLLRSKVDTETNTPLFNEMSELQKDLFLSMIIAELAAEFGSPSLAGEEGASWVRAFNTSRDFTKHGNHGASAGYGSASNSHSSSHVDANTVPKKSSMICKFIMRQSVQWRRSVYYYDILVALI